MRRRIGAGHVVKSVNFKQSVLYGKYSMKRILTSDRNAKPANKSVNRSWLTLRFFKLNCFV